MPDNGLHVKYITADETSLQHSACLRGGETLSTVYEHGITVVKSAAKGIIPNMVTAHNRKTYYPSLLGQRPPEKLTLNFGPGRFEIR